MDDAQGEDRILGSVADFLGAARTSVHAPPGRPLINAPRCRLGRSASDVPYWGMFGEQRLCRRAARPAAENKRWGHINRAPL